MNGSKSIVLGALALAVAFVGVARADCASDCSAQYERAMTACQTSNPSPDSADALQSCMDQAQSDYGACAAQCTGGQNDQDD